MQSEVQEADVILKDLAKELIIKFLEPLPILEFIKQVKKSENEKICKEEFWKMLVSMQWTLSITPSKMGKVPAL